MKRMVLAFFILIGTCSEVFAQAPPYPTVKITGLAKKPYNKVGLFQDGRSTKPIRYSQIGKENRQYSIMINVSKDMATYTSGEFGVDMRFWYDENENNQIDRGERASQCHFVLWEPKKKQMLFSIYRGATHKIESNTFKYDYGRILNEEVIKCKGATHYLNWRKISLTVRDFPDPTAKVLGNLEPSYSIPLHGIIKSGWVVVGSDGYIFDPAFVKCSLMDFDIEQASGSLEAHDQDIPIYTHPTFEAEMMGALQKGYYMPISGRVKGTQWFQIKYLTDGTKGYVLKP